MGLIDTTSPVAAGGAAETEGDADGKSHKIAAKARATLDFALEAAKEIVLYEDAHELFKQKDYVQAAPMLGARWPSLTAPRSVFCRGCKNKDGQLPDGPRFCSKVCQVACWEGGHREACARYRKPA